jgi:hypothetical protein
MYENKFFISNYWLSNLFYSCAKEDQVTNNVNLNSYRKPSQRYEVLVLERSGITFPLHNLSLDVSTSPDFSNFVSNYNSKLLLT